MRKTLYFYILIPLVSVIAMLYGNCSPNHSDPTGSSEGLSVECGDMKGLFLQTYRPFLQNTCVRCHVSGGVGKGSFADSNPEIAWASFQFAGYSKISAFAVNSGHNPPYTGSQNQAEIDLSKEKWLAGLEDEKRCQEGSGNNLPQDENMGQRYSTVAKTIGLTNIGQSRVIEWNLATELRADPGLTVPALPGATVSIKIEVVDVLGQISYYISEPRIKNSTVDIHVYSLRTKINGGYIPGETTFTFVEKNVYNRTDTLLSAGTMVALGRNNVSDTLQLSFEKLDVVVLPPPDLGPSVTFELAEQTRPESGFVDLKINLSKVPSRAVIVQVAMASESTAKQRRSVRNEAQPYDFFDWDVTLGSIADPTNLTTLTFIPGGELSQNVRVMISDDQRDELNETAIVRITNIENGVPGVNSQHVLTITDDDSPPINPFIKTFSQLMVGNGILNRRCLECHNTVLKEGGYDMTNYSSMIAVVKKILVPGQPLQSEMYKRIRLNGTGRMPLDQALDPVDQRDIENWIINGAQNN